MPVSSSCQHLRKGPGKEREKPPETRKSTVSGAFSCVSDAFRLIRTRKFSTTHLKKTGIRVIEGLMGVPKDRREEMGFYF